jgi:molybdenum cofactor guanylyltransferase
MGGGDKSLQLIGGKRILAHIIDRLRPQLDRVALSANGDTARFAAFSLPVVADGLPNFPGPLAGILAGMDWAGTLPACTHVVSIAGDTPFFPRDLVERLAAGSDSPFSIAVASSNGRRHPVFALWPIALRDELSHFLQSGNGKVSAFFDRHAAVDVEFRLAISQDATFDPFFNINTPGDLDEAQRILELDR